MKVVASEFVRSDRVKCKSIADVVALRKRGYREGSRSERFIYMEKPAKAYITVETDGGVRFRQDMRDQILQYYGLKTLQLQRFNTFLAQLYWGEIALIVTNTGEIMIK